MSGTPDADALLDVREQRFDSLMDRYVPYLGLVVGTALTPFAVELSGSYWLVTGGLVVVTAARAYVLATRTPVRAAADRRAGTVYVTGLLLLTVALVSCPPLYGFMAFAGYAHSFRYLRATGAGQASSRRRPPPRSRSSAAPSPTGHRCSWRAGSGCRSSTGPWPGP